MPLPVILAAALLAAPLPPEVNPALFPDADQHDATEIQLAGLAELYPGRILHQAPITLRTGSVGLPPFEQSLPRGVTYLRVYDLAVSEAKLTETLTNPLVIIDLRYVTADAPTAEAFADTLAKTGLDSAPVHGLGEVKDPADLPPPTSADKAPPLVLVLVNKQTSGPLEAWLAAFQAKQSVLAVGTTTAGQPGSYFPSTNHTDFFIISGELVPDSGSVVGSGLKPQFSVEVTPEQDYLAYQKAESNRDVSALLRQYRTLAATPAPAPVTASGTVAQTASPALPATTAPATTPAAASVSTTSEEVGDLVLQRAVDVVAALQVLGRAPSLKAPGAVKALDAAPANALATPAKN
ncbi:MAG TPA: hypothetical protein VK737_06390 [Opitutales bacterium]|nr:hypothetical protein [Opitutales bacterium]